ncbi:MAG: ABC transporter ATP-binding protein, partial [Microbacteriaceae bacterium]|nr:ABC transporter ATP-binding protein [Microbacteriaceae bacterium]
LELTELTVAYGGQRALDAVSLTVRQGDVHALIGPNGAGKTTLVDAVTGFLPAYDGRVALAGRTLDGLSVQARVRAGVRRTFQQPRGIDAMTVDEYLRLAAAGSGAGTDAGAAAALRAEVRNFFGLPGGDVPIRMMDVGSRRILEIAGALVSAPQLLLIDEPAAGLDVTQSLELAERVRRLPARFGCAVLLIEHDMRFVRAAANRATVLDAGRVIAAGATAAVLEHPRVVAAYLGTEIAR